MMKVSPAVWVIQRICAIVMIVTALIKLLSGYAMAGKLTFISPATGFVWHSNSALDIILVVSSSFHVFYGIRTILLDLGAGREKELFWVLTTGALVFSLIIINYVYVV